jgi:hypothetical protein
LSIASLPHTHIVPPENSFETISYFHNTYFRQRQKPKRASR